MTRPVLVLGPSLGTSASALWGACTARLEPDFDVIAWHLPGHGASRGPIAGDLTVAGLAADVLEDVARRTEGSFHYAGDSVGGAVGLQLLLDVADRVASAVLLCTGARIGTPESWQDRVAQARHSGTPSLVEHSARRWFATGFGEREREPARASALLHAIADTDDGGYAAVCGALMTFDVRNRLAEISRPRSWLWPVQRTSRRRRSRCARSPTPSATVDSSSWTESPTSPPRRHPRSLRTSSDATSSPSPIKEQHEHI